MRIDILIEAEIRQGVQLDLEAIDVVEEGFVRMAAGEATIPPILRVDIPESNGEVDVKTAYVRGIDSFAIKVSSGFFDNARLGLPSLSGMMMLFSTRTGLPEAMLLDNGYLTNVRTGAAGAVAARYLVREEIQTAGVIGAGAQARYQMLALRLVRDFKKLMVYSTTPQRVDRYADEMGPRLGAEVVKAPSAEAVVRGSDVVVTTTPAKEPYVKAGWLHPGLHITAMGSDAENKQELHADVLARADVLVCDRRSQAFRLGELHHGLEQGTIVRDGAIHELGEVASGRKPGRRHDEEITICDLTGVGVQDTVIAVLAHRKARQHGLGTQIDA